MTQQAPPSIADRLIQALGNFAWGQADPNTGQRPWSPAAHLGMAQDLGGAMFNAAREDPLQAASASMLPGVADAADIALAGRDIGQAMQDPSKANLLQAALGAGSAALPFFPYAAAIKAYHGSPHVFDKFDMSKVGTGEGAQAYGHGLYFAENPQVAKDYRNKLADVEEWLVGGRPARELVQDPRELGAAEWLYNMENDADAARIALQGSIRELERRAASRLPEDHDYRYYNDKLEQYRAELIGLERFAGQPVEKRPGGALYHTELQVEPEDLLDWDVPLSQQPPKVQEALAKLGFTGPAPVQFVPQPSGKGRYWEARSGNQWLDAIYEETDGTFRIDSDMSLVFKTPEEAQQYVLANTELPQTYGSELYSLLASKNLHTMDGERAASQALREAGVPGIRYKDAGSRWGDDAQATRNIVLFADELAKILARE